MRPKLGGKAERQRLLRAAGMKPTPSISRIDDDDGDDDVCLYSLSEYSRKEWCLLDHSSASSIRRHRDALVEYLSDHWGVIRAGELVALFGLNVLTTTAFEEALTPLDRFRSPSGYFISRCRKVGDRPGEVARRILREL